MAKRRPKAAAEAPETGTDGRAEIEALRARHKGLRDEKVTAEANLKTSQKALERLKKRALDEYQTDDVDELRKKLDEMKAENEKRRLEYEKHLDEIEAGLTKVEQEHKAAEGEAGGKA
jgi:2,3-bisphosphoglycerate-independent phosphoglycerate mutase